MIMFKVFTFAVLPALLSGFVGYKFYSLSSRKLVMIPGPFLAPFSSLYRVYLLWSGSCTEKYERLHKQYGSVVRTGPRHVITSDPAAVSTIYDTGWRFPKVCVPP